MTTEGRTFITTAELAEWLRTSPATVRYWRSIGTGPPSYKVGRRVIYDRAEVDAWIDQKRQGRADGL